MSLIIGSGIVGLNAALYLKRKSPNSPSPSSTGGSCPSGASTRNAGFACFGSPSEILADLKKQNEDAVFSWSNAAGKDCCGYGKISVTRRLLMKPSAATKYSARKMKSFIRLALSSSLSESSTEDHHRHRRELRHQQRTHQRFRLPEHPAHVVQPGEGQLDTGRMIEALLHKVRGLGVRILNGLTVEAIESNNSGAVVMCKDDIRFSARQVLLATNGFTKTLLPEVDVQPARARCS